MDQPRRPSPAERSVDELADAHDLRSVITAALETQPVDEHSLRRGVWTYVGAERDAGISPGHVIAALSDLVDAASMSSMAVRKAHMRRVILWSVEAYFGHLGGQGVGPHEAVGDAAAPVPHQ